MHAMVLFLSVVGGAGLASPSGVELRQRGDEVANIVA